METRKYALWIPKSSDPDYIHWRTMLPGTLSLRHALTTAGHQVSLILDDNPSLLSSDHTIIVIGWQLLKFLAHHSVPPTGSIIYNTEQLKERGHQVPPALYANYEWWDYSEGNIKQLEEQDKQHHKSRKLVTLGYYPEIDVTLPSLPQSTDVFFFGSMNARRQQLLDALTASGLKVETAFGVYGKNLHPYLARSKVILDMHYYGQALFNIFRVLPPLMMGKAVVSETSSDSYYAAHLKGGYISCPYDELVQQCQKLCADEDLRNRLGMAGQTVARNLKATLPF